MPSLMFLGCFGEKLSKKNLWRVGSTPPPLVKEGLRGLKGKLCIISIGENTLSVEYSDIYHVLINP